MRLKNESENYEVYFISPQLQLNFAQFFGTVDVDEYGGICLLYEQQTIEIKGIIPSKLAHQYWYN